MRQDLDSDGDPEGLVERAVSRGDSKAGRIPNETIRLTLSGYARISIQNGWCYRVFETEQAREQRKVNCTEIWEWGLGGWGKNYSGVG